MADDHLKRSLDDVDAALAAGELARALTMLAGFARTAPHDPAVLYRLGVAHGAMGDTAQADVHFERAADHAERAMHDDPTVAAATLFAKCLAGANRLGNAGAIAAARSRGDDPGYELLMCYAQAFTQLGQREVALAAYHAAAERNPVAVIENRVAPAAWITGNPFTAEAPSPRYRTLLSQYELMHRAGGDDSPGTGATIFEGFVGFSIVAPHVRRFCGELHARTLLDYGGGRGTQYDLGAITIGSEVFAGSLEYLGVELVACFDPALGGAPPPDKFDVVICVDALEHCDRQDLPWIVRHLFAKARLGVFANVASYSAAKLLPNGENAHCTVEDAGWWMELFSAVAAEFPSVSYRVIVSRDLRQNSRIVFERRVRAPTSSP